MESLRLPFVTTVMTDGCVHLLYYSSLTINVPVVYMGRYKVVLRGDYP